VEHNFSEKWVWQPLNTTFPIKMAYFKPVFELFSAENYYVFSSFQGSGHTAAAFPLVSGAFAPAAGQEFVHDAICKAGKANTLYERAHDDATCLLFDDSFLRCGLCRHPRDGNGFVPPWTNPSFFSIATRHSYAAPCPGPFCCPGNIIIL
jgi:hypothetical protein